MAPDLRTGILKLVPVSLHGLPGGLSGKGTSACQADLRRGHGRGAGTQLCLHRLHICIDYDAGTGQPRLQDYTSALTKASPIKVECSADNFSRS